MLVDRSFASDWVYSDGASIGWERWQEWEDYLLAHTPAIMVYVRTLPDTIRLRLRDDPDPYLPAEDIDLHLQRYDDYLGRTTLPVITCSGEHNVDTAARDVLAFMRNARSNRLS